jgi:hypothetical protein
MPANRPYKDNDQKTTVENAGNNCERVTANEAVIIPWLASFAQYERVVKHVDKLGKLVDIAAESDLIDGVVPGPGLTVVCLSYSGSLNNSLAPHGDFGIFCPI